MPPTHIGRLGAAVRLRRPLAPSARVTRSLLAAALVGAVSLTVSTPSAAGPAEQRASCSPTAPGAKWRPVADVQGGWLDACGRMVVVEPAPDRAALRELADPAASSSLRGPVPSVRDVVTLQSRPGAARTLFLDIDGALLAGTQWASLPGAPVLPVTPAFDVDGSTVTMSELERRLVQAIWAHVAEDFAPFDVNVTTQDPGPAALERTSASDTAYGSTVVLTTKNWVTTWCGSCTGIASLGVFSAVGLQPYRHALVFATPYRHLLAHDAAAFARVVGSAASHEAGHHLGLKHDGLLKGGPRLATSYHPGVAGWAPIMGSATVPLVRWADGSYAWANNPEDDLAVLTAQLGLAPDELPMVLTEETPVSGVVSSASDSDLVTFTARRDGWVVAFPDGERANLDLALDVVRFDDSRATYATPTVYTRGVLTGLDARFAVKAGERYVVSVRGDESPGIASRYGSVGRWTLAWTAR